jgi:hypothetical protein
MANTERDGRFQDYSKGDSLAKGYRDIGNDPLDKKFMKRNFAEYGVLKKGGLDKGLKQLRNYNDVQLESMAAKAVLSKAKIERKKLPKQLNKAKYNIKWAKKVMAKRAAGKTVRRQALKRTKAARRHILTIRRNRRLEKTPLYANLPDRYQ